MKTKIKSIIFFSFIATMLSFINCKKDVAKYTDVAVNNVQVNMPSGVITYDPNYNYVNSQANVVPQDIIDSTQVALCQFAWREFIALNYPSNYDTISYTRGKPDTSNGINGFLTVNGNTPTVWQTYKHRVEIYPDSTIHYNKSFNTVPYYKYKIDGQKSIPKLGDSLAPVLSEVTNIFNNLDESSEIDLCTLFFEGDPNAPGASNYPNADIASGLPGAPRRLLYEAKGNQDMFDYVATNQLYDSIVRTSKINLTENAIKNDGTGAVFPCPDNGQICFPYGGDQGAEGNILVKATWKQLTLKEYNSGRYLTAPIIYYRKGDPSKPHDTKVYYDIIPATPTSTTLPYGLAGLHIIHKTQNYPSYVFATFEQVDNLTPNSSNRLFYYNRDSNPSISSGKQYAKRYADILEDTDKINNIVQEQIKAKNNTSVWQYYKLIGVQGKLQNNDDTTDYFLANIVTETNQTLRDFSGTLDAENGTFDPTATNVYKHENQFVQGGCKGCHGNAQQTDFSFITKNAPITEPDVINQPLLKTTTTN